MTDELVTTLKQIGEEQHKLNERLEQRFDELGSRVESLEARKSSPGKTATETKAPEGIAGLDRPEVWVDRKSGEVIPVLTHKDRWSAGEPNTTGVSVGRWLRGVLTGKYSDDRKELSEEMKALATAPDASGGYTVPKPLAREFIDMLRDRMVLSRAGARTVPMTSKTLSIAKIVSDADVAWHAESAPVNDDSPAFDAVDLSAKTVVGLVKLSLELSQDSINVEQAIVRSLTGSMGVEIDRAGLMGDGSSNSPTGISEFSGRNIISSVGALEDYDKFLDGVGLLLAQNVPLERVGPIVLGTAAWADLAKLKTGITSDKTPLVRPEALTMPFLPTTAVEDGSPLTSTAYVADWSDLLYGVRQDITVRVLNEAFFGSNLQIAVLVYARVDFAAAREQSFVTLEGITH